jgi:hypothetical protein
MANALTSSDRKSLIRLASSMEKGSDERKVILSGLASVRHLVAALSGQDKDIAKIFQKEVMPALRKIQSNQGVKSKIEVDTDASFSGNSEPKFRVFAYFTVNIADYLKKGPSGPSWLVKNVERSIKALREEVQGDWEDEGKKGKMSQKYFANSVKEDFQENYHFSLEAVYFHPESKAFEGRRKKGHAGLAVTGTIEAGGYRIYGTHDFEKWYSFPPDDLRKLEGDLRKGLKVAVAEMS